MKYEEWRRVFEANIGVSPTELAHRYGVGTSTIRHHQGRWRREGCGGAARRQPRATILPTESADTIPSPSLPEDTLPPAAPVGDKVWKVAFVPDAHVPYHDRTAWAVMLAGIREFYGDSPANCRILVVMGDLADWYMLSSHSKSRTRLLSLEDEVISVRTALDQLDALGAGWKKYVSGNHEYRWDRYLNDKAPEMFGMCQMREVLGLQARGWEWVPYRDKFKLGDTAITHDLQKAGVTALRLSRRDAGCGVIIGHIHRMGAFWMAEMDGQPMAAMSFGWLGDHRSVTDYRHFGLAQREWTHGFGTAYLGADGVLWPTPVPIVGGKCRVEGTLVSV